MLSKRQVIAMLWLLALPLLSTSWSCQNLEQPVCQPCETLNHCTEDEVCFGRYSLCIPKGTCYCPRGQESCSSTLCQESRGTCNHPTAQPAGTCGAPKACQQDNDCSAYQSCKKQEGQDTGVCQFRFLCTLPPECKNGETRECKTELLGECGEGIQTCRSNSWSACISSQTVREETCNGKDDNCDGKIDNGLVCVETLAGKPGQSNWVDGPLEKARFHSPRAIISDSKGNLYIADTRNHAIRKIDTNGVVSTIAGGEQAGFRNGPGTQALFNEPIGIAMDEQGNLFVADSNNHRIRMIKPNGEVTTFAGKDPGLLDETGEKAQFKNPHGLVFDKEGNLYVADTNNHVIRKVDKSGKVTTVAGTGTPGYRDGQGDQAKFNSPYGIAITNEGRLYIADTKSHLLRWIDTNGVVHTLAGGFQKGDWVDESGDRARFNSPSALFVDKDGTLLLADIENHSLRRVNNRGRATTFAGMGSAGSQNGDALKAQFKFPWGVTMDSKGNIYVADTDNNTIRRIVTNPK